MFGFLENLRFEDTRCAAEQQTEFRPWTPEQRWAPWLPLLADTYHPPMLFPEVKPEALKRGLDLGKNLRCCVKSPTGKFIYRNNLLPAKYPLGLYKRNGYGRECSKGYAFFDKPVITPALYQRDGDDDRYHDYPWMSFTPNALRD